MVKIKDAAHFVFLVVSVLLLGSLLVACGDSTNVLPPSTVGAVPTATEGVNNPPSQTTSNTTAAATTPTATLPTVTAQASGNTSPAVPTPEKTKPASTKIVAPPPAKTTAAPVASTPVGGNSFNNLSDWWNRNHDASLTNFNPNEKTLTAANVGSLVKLWATDTTSSHALVWNTFVILQNASGQLQSYEIQTGQPAATYGSPNQDEYFSYSIQGTGLIYVSENSGQFLTAYDLLGGSQVYKVATRRAGDPANTSSLVDVVVQTNNLALTTIPREGSSGQVYAINGQAGNVKWAAKTAEANYVSPNWVVAGNLAILNSVPEAVAYDLNTGQEIWHNPLNGGLYRQMLAANGTLVTYKANGGVAPAEFAAYDAQTGNLKWRKTFEGSSSGAILASNGAQVFLGVNAENGSAVYSLDLATGKELWKQTFQGNIPRTAALTNDLLFFAAGNNIYALQTGNGKTVQKLGTQWAAVDYVSHIAVAEGRLLVTGSTAQSDIYRTFVYGFVN